MHSLDRVVKTLADIENDFRESTAKKLLNGDLHQVNADVEFLSALHEINDRLQMLIATSGGTVTPLATKPVVVPNSTGTRPKKRKQHGPNAEIFMEPILAILKRRDGTATIADIVSDLKRYYPTIIKSVRVAGESKNRPRWKLMVYWCGKRLTELGKIIADKGVWSLK